MELKKIKGNTYYISGPVNIGVYVENNEAIIIDSGNGKDAAKKILNILEKNNWKLKTIVNTHSHADHIGGNKYLKNKTNCEIVSPKVEGALVENTLLEPSMLWGASPLKELRNKFLEAEKANVDRVLEEGMIENNTLEAIELKGHSFNMFGYKTKDNVFFVADSVFSKDIIEKYNTFYLYDVEEYIKTLDKLKEIDADIYIPSHAEPTNCIDDLVFVNNKKIEEISELILKIITKPKSFEHILAELCNHYKMTLNSTQYVLQGSTIKAYLTYLYAMNKITYCFEDNNMLWLKKA